MKQRPILFNTEMVQAILAGRKTQTRRVVKFKDHQPTAEFHFLPSAYPHFQFQSGNRHWQAECPYGKPGDVLWVRETWTPLDTQEVDSTELDEDGIPLEEFQVEIGYKDGMSKWCVFSEDFYDQMNEDIEDMEQEGTKWKPSIHMPKDAARIWLRIKDVRVERLQDISDEDIRAEGAAEFGCTTHRLNWQTLWESVNGSNSWKDNPFVWVIEFERIEKP
jgi:uncharacterized protein YhfF